MQIESRKGADFQRPSVWIRVTQTRCTLRCQLLQPEVLVSVLDKDDPMTEACHHGKGTETQGQEVSEPSSLTLLQLGRAHLWCVPEVSVKRGLFSNISHESSHEKEPHASRLKHHLPISLHWILLIERGM